jgi:putative heme-binding domain-containing protein
MKSKEERFQAMKALASLTGNGSKGREVFQRSCVACHRVGQGEGNDYGPNFEKLMAKMGQTRQKLIESIIDPNAEVDEKYLTTKVERLSGGVVQGLVVGDTAKELVIFDGKDKKVIPKDDIDGKPIKLKQSSMPEGLAGTMAPSEFVDLIEYLANLK